MRLFVQVAQLQGRDSQKTEKPVKGSTSKHIKKMEKYYFLGMKNHSKKTL